MQRRPDVLSVRPSVAALWLAAFILAGSAVLPLRAEPEQEAASAESLVKGLLSTWPESHFHTTLGVNGIIERRIFQETDDTPAAARNPKLWKGLGYSKESDQIWPSGFHLFPYHDTPPNPSDPERAYIYASGQFTSVKDVPDHFLVKAPGGGESRLTREYASKDLVLATEYRWSETLTGGVSREEMKKARNELADLLIPLAEEIFEEQWGKEYDATELFKAVRAGGKDWAFEAADQLYAEMATRGTTQEKGAKVLAAWRDGLTRRGFKDGGDLNQQLIERMRPLIRRRDGKPEPIFSGPAGLSITSVQKVIERRFKSVEGLKEKVTPLLARAFGPYAAEWRLREFRFTLSMPGAIAETNGGPPEQARGGGGMCCAPTGGKDREPVEPWLAAESTVQWRFWGLETYPAGYTMKARSLLGDDALQKQLFGKARLNTPEKAKTYADLVAGSEKLLNALKSCREDGRIDALTAYHKETAAGQDKEEAARVDKLLGLLQPKDE